jgi:hypothetical protein
MAEALKHEPPGVAARRVAVIMAVIIGLLIAVAFGFTLIFHDRLGTAHVTVPSFPAPGVRPDEGLERQQLEARQQHRLSGADGGMPIDDAMRAIVAKGTHAFDPVGGPP